MCAIVAVSLFLTAYMAVVFNRRAKADMLKALTPLAAVMDGEVDLEEARADGRYKGHISSGRAANAAQGPGRVFLTSLIDGAGGLPWTYTARRSKEAGQPSEISMIGPGETTDMAFQDAIGQIALPMLTAPGWLEIDYDPTAGHVRLTQPMQTRRDIPPPDSFRAYLDSLVRIAGINRARQHPEP
jgi:hypothetical protein